MLFRSGSDKKAIEGLLYLPDKDVKQPIMIGVLSISKY